MTAIKMQRSEDWLRDYNDKRAKQRQGIVPDERPRSADGFVEVGPKIIRRGKHKSPYLFQVAAYCRSLGVPEPEGEWYFHDDREWRLDLAWPMQKVALEIDGGLWSNGAHSRGSGIKGDHEKRNAATAQGWRLFYADPSPRSLAEVIMLIANSCLRSCK